MSPFTGTANPEELAIMTKAFEDHCLVHNVVHERDRDDVARLITLLCQGGAGTVEEIRAGLKRLRRP